MKKYLPWVLSLVAAIIMLQTLYFKFTANPESVYIFTAVGMEPWGRIGTGVAELIASILLLIPSVRYIGAFLSAGIMAGAIASHIFLLGIEIQGDGGYLFILAFVVLLSSGILLLLDKEKILMIIKSKLNK
ncbi:DoxX family protein [bacterium 336/3]|nr:DoxX family protein [bacterium 336/3]